MPDLELSETSSKSFDIAIIGGGILGVSTAYWLSKLYNCSLVIVEKEQAVSIHTSSRNTGVLHRPFYLNPKSKKIFADAAKRSYPLWRSLALRYDLPWKQVGTLEVATREENVRALHQYGSWAVENGMKEDEFEILDSRNVKSLEPEVSCIEAFHSKTDTAVDFGLLSKFVFELSTKNGTKLVKCFEARNFSKDSNGKIRISARRAKDGGSESLSCKLMINLAGGNSIDIAHKFHLAQDCTDLHFRGEYWRVGEPFASRISRSIYSVPRVKEFPFLDPHFVVRVNGIREIGPNATLVTGPYTYRGSPSNKKQIFSKIFEKPIYPKLKLFSNGTFLNLIFHEWRSSISKKAMMGRVKEFIPSLSSGFLVSRGVDGVRSSVVDSHGFVSEAMMAFGENSLHVLNYNSPGATGAPAFSAHVVSELGKRGYLDGFAKRSGSSPDDVWSFEEALI
jgi:(S)-2-hydroxyglutarate dehydrogenase